MNRSNQSKLWLFILAGLTLQNCFAAVEPGHPRIMAIAIGDAIHMDQPEVQRNISKANVAILGFWPHWKEYENKSIRNVVIAIKKYNPNILVGQYTNLNEAKGKENPDKTSIDIANKLDQQNWWLKGATGGRIQHTDEFGAWEVNLTNLTQPDDHNRHYPEWLAERNFQLYFKNTPEFDFWFLDITVPQSPVLIADWDNSGIPKISALPKYSKAYRDGHRAYWDRIRALQPQTLLIGNAHDLTPDEYKGQLDGALLEAAMGLKWSTYEQRGWEAVRKQYYEFMQDTRGPKIVGFNVWGAPSDYQKMRFGLATCLLNDGYFSYTDPDKGYTGTVWFDEFDLDLGKPLEAPPEQPWSNGVYRRLYEKGAVLVNPSDKLAHVSLNNEYTRFYGAQAPAVNSGKSVDELDIPAKDGLVVLRKSSPPATPALKAIPDNKP